VQSPLRLQLSGLLVVIPQGSAVAFAVALSAMPPSLFGDLLIESTASERQKSSIPDEPPAKWSHA